ncbi:MAG: rhodanese-like domain-containing protein [Myxococcota bacterium]
MSYTVVDPRTAHAKQAEGWRYVDVRTPEEFGAGHPEGAVNVPIWVVQAGSRVPNDAFVATLQRLFPTSTPLLMGCRTGARSAMACDLLVAAGYTTLANVDGGFVGTPTSPGWADEGLPVSTTGASWAEISRGAGGR